MSDKAALPSPAVRAHACPAHASPGHAVALVLVAAFMVLADVSTVNTAAPGIAVIGLAVLAAVPEGRLENASAEHLANGFSIALGVMVAVFLVSAVLVAKLPKPAEP